MPCCAFAACIVAQLLLGIGAFRRALFGGSPDGLASRNAAVEWRLDSKPATADLQPPSGFSRPRLRLRPTRGLAIAAAIELVIVLGAIYGGFELLEHFGGHHGDHTHVHVAR